jgi:threonine/homoserine/homoserine lactone efflux protein
MILPVDPSRYLAYLGVMAAMASFPGPANLFSVATGMARGWAAALAGVAGMNSATLIWYGAAALGLGALIAAFPGVFQAFRIAGALYLVWLAWQAVRASGKGAEPAGAARPGRAFRDGFAVQIANPKIVLFFGAVLPPFIDVERPLVPQLALFAVATIGMDVAAMSAYGLGGAALASRMQSRAFRHGFAYITGAMLLAAAILVAISG